MYAQSRHLVDVAHTQLRLGRPQAAEWAALHRLHRLPRVLVGELLTRGRPSARLRELAQRLQATPDRLEE